MSSRSREIYIAKRKTLKKGDAELVQQVAEGKDIMSIFMRANTAADPKDRLSEDEVIEQMSVIISAAMDTTSSVLSRDLQILAENLDIQEKLRQELLNARAADGLTHDELNRLQLLDSVCRETLRVYPPVTNLFRNVTKDTVLPLTEPIYTTDGSRMDNIPVPAGTQLLIGFLGCNTSKALWGEDAYEWKHERWMSPLPSTVTDARIPGVYSNLVTFMEGKRGCMQAIPRALWPSLTFADVAPRMRHSGFKFFEPIEWNVANVWYPIVGKDSNKPQLPLKVRLYKEARA
ncbi:hypothetical protein FOMPIDRAFT_1121281 [Fomitopsis schrenkii]|uniref:Cytochrome P450 n=1 Tax=Fomitopsis schrenkii TaxID=2126942 RepID=S8E8T7_FOMSC|nr:hypothetical protein FOMPIDRAFT_1121281 [Fomitopsis schrenkii]